MISPDFLFRYPRTIGSAFGFRNTSSTFSRVFLWIIVVQPTRSGFAD
jgi:hypothetical protein